MKEYPKLENKSRVEEVAINRLLDRVGVHEESSICDYGAGTGIFTIEMAKRTKNKVYALDSSDDMVESIKEKVQINGLDNLLVKRVETDQVPLDNESIDLFVLITVFHHIQDTTTFISEIKRVLKRGGRVALVEFHKGESPMGPPAGHRLSPSELEALFVPSGFSHVDYHVLGENMYLSIFER